MINLIISIAILKEAEVQGCPSTVSLNRCDKKAIILVCNVWMKLYVGLCNIDFIKLMIIILVCDVCMNICVSDFGLDETQ